MDKYSPRWCETPKLVNPPVPVRTQSLLENINTLHHEDQRAKHLGQTSWENINQGLVTKKISQALINTLNPLFKKCKE